MKNKLVLLLLLFVSFNICLADEAEKLPEVLWKAIVESQKGPYLIKWQTDVSIKLFGNYSKTDSLMVETSISKLNKLVQTIHVRMSPYDRGNLKLFFIDSTHHSNITLPSYFKKSNHNGLLISVNGNAWLASQSIKYVNGNAWLDSQSLDLKGIPEAFRQNFLTNTLAFALFPHYWFDDLYDKRKRQNEKVFESIFRSIGADDRDKLFLGEMQEFDKKLLSVVYSSDFDKKLKIAQKQIESGIFIPGWLKINPYSFLLLPLFLLLFLLTTIYLKISSRIVQNVTNKFLRFNINALILGFFFSIIVSFYISLAFYISLNIKYLDLSQVSMSAFLGAGVILIVGLLTINLLRLLEIIIHRNTHRKLLRIGLIFLTTGFIPFSACLAVFLYFVTAPLESEEIKVLSFVFLGCMIVAAFRALISYFFFKEKDLILENETKLSNLRELKTKAELNALHSRINPHFLYNSLNSIAGLAHEDANKTEHMALSLSKLFRYSINRDQSDWTTFKEEMEMVKIYLEVEKVRFDDRLRYSVDLPPELEDYKIPRFIIQPLVENAVKHGISKSVESGQIKVAVTQEGRKIFISVSDDGPAFPQDLTPGFGIQSIYDKLEILYKDKFKMNFINYPQKQVIIELD